MSKEKSLEKIKQIVKEIGIARMGLLIFAGVVLLLFSMPEKQTETVSEEKEADYINEETEAYVENLEERLTNALTMVEGIGQVQVMITLKNKGENVVLKDNPYNKSSTIEKDSQGGTRENEEIADEESTVLQKMESGNEVPYVTKKIQPQVEGVVVIAKGAGNSRVEKDINDAVVALFAVPSHKIKVMKMK